MIKRNCLLATTCAVSLIAGSPALSDAQSTQILEEYFDLFKSTPMVLAVGDKEDAGRYTQWNNITLKSDDGKAQVAIPWVKVSKKLLGGHVMTLAPKIDGAFQSPDPEVLEPVKFAIESKEMSVDISGDTDARSYASSFDEVLFQTLDNDQIKVSAKMVGGTGDQIMEAGENGKSTGSFDVKSMVIDYDMTIEGQDMKSTTSMESFAGKFEVPFYKDYDPDNPASFFDPARNMLIDYTSGAGSSKMSMVSETGPIDVNATFGGGSGTLGIADSIAKIAGTTSDLTYDVSAPQMGLPSMQFTMVGAKADISVPLDNVDESKPAGYKLALNQLKLSDQLWAMFDPKAVLPRDAIDLDIDLTANMRWLKKIAEIDIDDKEQKPPFALDSAEIIAFNLNLAGASLQTDGAVALDNTQFPPVPDGTVNVSLKGGQGLLSKLTEMGLIPAQQAMPIRAMTAMFFKPGGDGDDHLISTIEMTKDGHIKANGMPLK